MWDDVLTVEEGSPLGARALGSDLSFHLASWSTTDPMKIFLFAFLLKKEQEMQPFLCQLF